MFEIVESEPDWEISDDGYYEEHLARRFAEEMPNGCLQLTSVALMIDIGEAWSIQFLLTASGKLQCNLGPTRKWPQWAVRVDLH
jgi:hypothetical protein